MSPVVGKSLGDPQMYCVAESKVDANSGVIVRTLRCNIEDLATWHPWFFVEPQVVACVAMLARQGGPPAYLDVDCLNIKANWLGNATQFRLEMAATALALVISHHILHLGQLDVTNYGDRTDFRSTRISCMLEVSGTANHSQLTRRHRQKVAQAMANPLGWNAYVIVCAFSSRGHRIRFSFHSVQEPVDDQTPA
jgi:hypothetical protein